MYPIPLEFLENKTEVRFIPAYHNSASIKRVFNEYEFKYYQIENLICDNAALSDFEIDEEGTVVDVLQQADTYAELDSEKDQTTDPNRIIKSEFKDTHEPLILKNDHQIYSTKNQAKNQSKNFFFVMSCVKVR